MSSFILVLSAVALLQSPPEKQYQRLVHVVSGNPVVRTVQLPWYGRPDITYVHTARSASFSDDEIIWQALSNCKYASSRRRGETLPAYEARRANEEAVLRELLEIEKRHGVPDSLRGMLLAAACHESGYNRLARGDRKFSKNKKRYLAKGLFQMWPWWERAYKIKRTNVNQSANAYLTHIKKQTLKVRRVCGKRIASSEKKKWIVGWATAIRAPKPGGRCYEKPRFYRILRRWHRNINNYRQQVGTCADEYKDGCGC